MTTQVFRNIIDGEAVDAASGRTYEVENAAACTIDHFRFPAGASRILQGKLMEAMGRTVALPAQVHPSHPNPGRPQSNVLASRDTRTARA